ncbi:MAG: hypothetical protein ACPIOQ_78190, partial [Promethearchaeia archaeon]
PQNCGNPKDEDERLRRMKESEVRPSKQPEGADDGRHAFEEGCAFDALLQSLGGGGAETATSFA